MSSQETLLNGRYRLLAQQGSGGMAVIYKATDLALGRTVAVKILRPSLTSDPEFLKRFRQEARTVANLSHPNLVIVHDVGNDGHSHYIVMEHVDGKDLKRLIRADAPFSIELALRIDIANPHRIYAGTSEGLYLSQDDGATWVRYNEVPSTFIQIGGMYLHSCMCVSLFFPFKSYIVFSISSTAKPVLFADVNIFLCRK